MLGQISVWDQVQDSGYNQYKGSDSSGLEFQLRPDQARSMANIKVQMKSKV